LAPNLTHKDKTRVEENGRGKHCGILRYGTIAAVKNYILQAPDFASKN